ncbi:MAG: hypothetical protein HUJ68_09820 [Clostridia bacterium]|nr:hypothetical protein [Clostridia bacterium]
MKTVKLAILDGISLVFCYPVTYICYYVFSKTFNNDKVSGIEFLLSLVMCGLATLGTIFLTVRFILEIFEKQEEN